MKMENKPNIKLTYLFHSVSVFVCEYDGIQQRREKID